MLQSSFNFMRLPRSLQSLAMTENWSMRAMPSHNDNKTTNIKNTQSVKKIFIIFLIFIFLI
ncbi:hypothetical protein [Rickettsia felis]|uniref:hypothetical protein n=1 Tax=Rickettsia felis TaxID=42862 RepID=UPI0012E02A3A|nr:hypothetical protein [Rickettsia felis]